MNIQVNINNFRKIQQASLEISPIAFLVGENENGKSSIAQAVAMAASGHVLPKNMAKKDAKQLVHDGAKSGKVSLTRDGLTCEITWPLCEHNELGQGKPLHVSEFAVGLKNIFQLSSTDKAAYFINLLKAEPTEKDLKLVLPKSVDARLPEIWKQIKESGWDEAHSTAKKEETELTGRWKQETGENSWNVSKAGKWRPETWEQDLERGERQELEVDYAHAHKALEDALKAEGAANFDKSLFEEQAAGKAGYQKELAEKEPELQAAEVRVRDLHKQLGVLPKPDDEGAPCPECGTHLVYRLSSDLLGKGVLEKTAAISEDEKKKRQDEINSAQAELDQATKEAGNLRDCLATIRKNLETAINAESQLEKHSGDAKNISDGNTEQARQRSAHAELRLDNFNKVQKATALYEQILTQKELVTALSQNGVRKTKLDEQVAKFNSEVLKPLCNKFGWEMVWIDNELNIWRGNRPYNLLSRSARYITRIILQVSIAIADRSELLVIDDMDEINDRQNRGGLLSMIISSGIPALICMAKRGDENAPDLAIGGDGNTYLVKNGVVELFSQSRKEVNAA